MLTPDQFTQRADARFGDNEYQHITEKSFRDFAADVRATFVALATANIPDYESGRYYPQDFIIQHAFGGTSVYLKATEEGFLPAPTNPAGDTDWVPTLSPPANNAQVGTVAALRLAQGKWVLGRLFVLTGRLDAQGHALPDVYVRALSDQTLEPTGYALDLHAIPQLPAPVRYDLDSDTTAPIEQAVDAYTKAQTDTLLTQLAAATAGATEAQKQRIDALLAGADGSVDTFIEAYNRFATDESAAAALNGQVSSLQIIQQQHTQQLGTLATNLSLLSAQLFGRNRGAYAANVAYLKYDFVAYQGAQYYASAAFTSGASFEASKWTAAPAGAVAAPVSGRFRGITFLANAFFKQNDWFLYQDVMLAAKTDFTTGATFDEADWKKAGPRPGVQFDQETQVSQVNYPGGITLVNRRAYFFDDAAADVTSCTLPAADPSGAYGLVLVVRNALGSGKAVTLTFTNRGTVDGQASLTLAEGEWRQLTQNASPVRPGDFSTQLQGGPNTGGGPGPGPATVPPQELQFSTPDSNNRIGVLALTAPVTLLSAQALPARNCQGLSYQVNTYDTTQRSWLPGAERTTLTETQTDIAVLTADQYAHGAELLVRVAPVDASKAARGLVKLTAADRLVMPSGTRPSLRLSSSVVYSSFLAFYEAGTAGNTDTLWQDLSGNGRHLVPRDGSYKRMVDADGRTVYRNQGSSSWAVPELSAMPADYTFYFFLRLYDTSYGFLFDSLPGRLILPVNGYEGSVYTNGWRGANNVVPASQLVTLTWRLNSAAGAVLMHNNAPYLTTTYGQVPLTGTTTLGRRSEADMFSVNADLIKWGVRLGNDPDDVTDATNKYMPTL